MSEVDKAGLQPESKGEKDHAAAALAAMRGQPSPSQPFVPHVSDPPIRSTEPLTTQEARVDAAKKRLGLMPGFTESLDKQTAAPTQHDLAKKDMTHVRGSRGSIRMHGEALGAALEGERVRLNAISAALSRIANVDTLEMAKAIAATCVDSLNNTSDFLQG